MTLKDELDEYVKDTFGTTWVRRDGQKVPETDDLSLKNEGVDLDATILYADMADSTGLVKGWKDWFAAEIYKNYLYCAVKIIKANGGVITAYDGDRVMGVFIDSSKNSHAAKSALQIRWAVDHIIKPALKSKYADNKFVLNQRVGIDTSKVMVTRTGVRGSNDLVWVGNSANNAAKLAALDLGYSSYITESSYSMLHDWAKVGGDPKRGMWTDLGTTALGFRIYGSNWHWSL
jgi:class 3 adenylate cyclase